MMSYIRMLFTLGFLILWTSAVSSDIAWTNIQTSFVEGQVDTWTKSLSGCSCKNETQSEEGGDCACCMEDNGGCQCGFGVTNRCGQCGLQEFCDNMCNITISSSAMKNSSGRSFGEIKSPSSAIGPLFCWYKLMAEPDERIEIQIYRIKRLGKLDLENRRCVGGSLQFLRGSRLSSTSPLDLNICGENERYSPPVVLFKDYQEGIPGIATFLFKVDVPSSSRSQFIAHYAFLPKWERNEGSHFQEETTLRIRGGVPLPGSNSLEEFLDGESQEGEEVSSYFGMGCDWLFTEKNCSSRNSSCSFASPGFPGIYDPNKACKYLINRDEDFNSRIRITFTSFNLPPNLCVEHFVSIYDGKTIRDPILHTLCGYLSPGESYDFNGPSILVEFSSSHVLPPYHFNGFAATIEFLSFENEDEEDVDGLEDEDDHEEEDDEEEEDIEEEYGEDNDYGEEIESIPDEIYNKETKKNKKRKNSSQKDPLLGEECKVEYRREHGGPTSGLVSSNNFESLKGKKCRLILKGHKGDVLKILFKKLSLTGDNECGAYLRISTPSTHRSPRLNILHKICSPFDLVENMRGSFPHSHIPLLINSSTVYLDFKYAGKSKMDTFEALFDFHNVLTQGHPVPNSTCDTIYSSYGSRVSRGPMKIFGESELLRQLGGFVRCSTALIPQEDQTVTIKIKSVSGISPSMSSECQTSCNENGCRCQTHRHDLNDVNYVLLASFNGGNIACLCGNFTDLLPLKIVSSTSLVITYNAASGNENSDYNLFEYTSSFNFNANSYDDLCSPLKQILEPRGAISSGVGKRRKMKESNGLNYYHGFCQWFFDVNSKIVINIKTDTKHYDCSTWNISLIPEWSRNPISEYIFCPEDVSKDYLLNTSKITLRLSSLSPFPVDYVISWRPHNSTRMEQEFHFASTTEDILMSDEEERPIFKEQMNKGAVSAEASSSSSQSLIISSTLISFMLYLRIYSCFYIIFSS